MKKNFILPLIVTSALAIPFTACTSSSSSTDPEDIFAEITPDNDLESSESGALGSSSSEDPSGKSQDADNSSTSSGNAAASSTDGTASSSSVTAKVESSSAEIPGVESSSSQVSLPLPGESFTDTRDGKTYKLTKIGTQVWMAENLNYGDSALYDYNDAKKACPENYHLPTLKDFQKLVAILGGKEVAGKKLKSSTGWPSDEEHGDWNGTDEVGFNAKPVASGDGTGTDENFWSSTINTRDHLSADFLKISAFPVFTSEDKSLRGGYTCNEARDAEKPADMACFINGDIETKLSVRCLSNIEECGGKNIDNTKQFCQDGVAYDMCRQRQYDGTKYECRNDTLYERASGEVFKFPWFLLNPEKTYGTFKDDRDGQVYKTIDIDGITIFAENLNYASEGSICPLNDDKYCDVYGRLYTELHILGNEMPDTNFHQGVCPKGTHLATYREFKSIVDKYDEKELITTYTKYFEDDDFDQTLSYPNNASGLSMLENGAYKRTDKDDWSGINRLLRYIGSNFEYYLYYLWAPSGVSQTYYYSGYEYKLDDNSFGSVRCVVE